ncbi:MAG: TylF/MycF family methyltransferase [Deltaproteobacteria bacterium]|jgi:hypothetical protein|nr:TylF/MycF family methyltransferase [Deltaproteobacteria bacterium]
MGSQFGFLAKLGVMQNLASGLVACVDPVIIHNMEKYSAILKIFYYTAIEDIQGDYLEFGVYTGSSFCHALRCCKKTLKYGKQVWNSSKARTRFFGFDSFEGFGEVSEGDKHPFFEDSNFATSYEKVQKRVAPFRKHFDVKLIKGFYNESLHAGPAAMGIEKARIIFVDCDTYTAAKDVFEFCAPIVQEGTIIVLDDRVCYKGNREAGVTRAFEEFKNYSGASTRLFSLYGMGAGIQIVSGLKR